MLLLFICKYYLYTFQDYNLILIYKLKRIHVTKMNIMFNVTN